MLKRTFTVGLVVAYLSYQMFFHSVLVSMTDNFFWNIPDVYKERLSDIVLTTGHIKGIARFLNLILIFSFPSS